MKGLTLAASVTLAVSVPAAAAAKPVTPPDARQYARLYHQVGAKFGGRAPGRNIVRWGIAHGRRVTDAQVLASIGVLERMLAPSLQSVQPLAQMSSAGLSAAPTGSSLPACTWQPESGGNASAVNASSGAGGYYQIMPSTWAAYGGTGAPENAPMSEQTAIAQRIYQSQGASAWTNC